MSPSHPASVYFPGFNGIRFLAASAVVVHHIEQYKTTFGYTDTFIYVDDHPIVYQAGKLGVALFFVLSGFLITYLLLAEKQTTGTIHIRNFYVRRVLRIWPLYFLIVGLSFFVIPHIPALYIPGVSEHTYEHFGEKLTLFGLVLPNFALTFYHEMPFCSHTWSIGVEEQFYLIWPWLVGSRNPRRTLLILLVVAVALAGWFFYLRFGPGSTAPQAGTTMLIISDFLAHFRIGCMAVGGFGAYLVFTKHPILRFLYQPLVQWAVYAVLVGMLAMGVRIPGLNYEGYAVFFAFLLMNLAANPKSVVNLENGLCNSMGKISYGLYMYHPLAIVICLYFVRQAIPYGPGFSIMLYVASYALTALLAWVSYEYFEKQFLKLKDRFAPGAPKPILAPETAQPDTISGVSTPA